MTEKIEMWSPERLIPYENNVKKHGPEQIEKIAASIREFGWRGNPIVVDEDDVIIAGHGRRLASLHLGLKEVPVVVARDLSDDQIKALRLADNRVGISEIDSNLLQVELSEISVDLSGIFDEKELQFLNADLGEINTDALSDNLDADVADQAVETAQRVAETDSKPIKIEKALGFKSVSGADERLVARFMAIVEEQTGKTGSDAFMTFVKGLVA